MNVRKQIEELAERARAVRPATWVIMGGSAVMLLVVWTGWGLLRSHDRPAVHRRAAHAVHAARAPGPDEGRPLAPAPKDAAPSVSQLVAQTRAPTCAQRSEAAEKLAGTHNPMAIAALRRLAGSSFKDESASPGIFSCSSRRAAQKALQQSGS